ncbi:hypothetical protein ACOSQ2_018707 [Xanthoceras sorbifolium]
MHKSRIPKTTWLVWGLRVFFLDLPFPPSPVWVVLGVELGCVRAAGASFDQLPEVCGAVGVRSACDLLPGGPDRGLPPRSTSSTIGLDCSGVERPLSELVSCAGCGGGGLNQGPVSPIWTVRRLVVIEIGRSKLAVCDFSGSGIFSALLWESICGSDSVY